MLRLYDNLSSGNAYKVRLILAVLGLPFERIEMDIDAGSTRTPEFLAINPDGRVPVLVFEDGRCLAQSNAIIFHLAEGTSFLSTDAFERAETLQWLFFEQYSHEPNIATPRYWLTHGVEMTEERRIALPGKRRAGWAALQVMERRLGDRDWMVGDKPSIADIALYAYTHVAEEGGFSLEAFPAIRDWIARFQRIPRYVPSTETFARAPAAEGALL